MIDFTEDERLYRAVRPNNMFWDATGRLSSAAFKDKHGLSTDRSMGRTKEACIKNIQTRLQGSIISISVKDCADVKALAEYAPVCENKYHTLVLRNDLKKELSSGQARALATVAQIEHQAV